MNIASDTCVWTGGSPCESEQLHLCGSGRDWLAFFSPCFGAEHGKTDQGGDQVPAGPTTQKMAWFVLRPLGNYDCHPTRTKAS